MTDNAELYDLIYHGKDYRAEAEALAALIERHHSQAETLLDVACGTGKHLEYLAETYDVAGVDIDGELLAKARTRLPNADFYEQDMLKLSVPQTFDVVTCLFSAIGYIQTPDNLDRTIANFAAHVNAPGLVIVEPWLTPDVWKVGQTGLTVYDTPDHPEVKITRMNTAEREGDLSIMTMHYLVGTPTGIDHHVETHALGLFSLKRYIEAFAKAGLDLQHDTKGLMGRGLFVGLKR